MNKRKKIGISIIVVFCFVLVGFTLNSLNKQKSSNVLQLPSKKFAPVKPGPDYVTYGTKLTFTNIQSDQPYTLYTKSHYPINDILVETTALWVHYDRYYKYNDNTLILLGGQIGMPEQHGDQMIGTSIGIDFGIAIFEDDKLTILKLNNMGVTNETYVSKSDKEGMDDFANNLIESIDNQIAILISELDSVPSISLKSLEKQFQIDELKEYQ